MSVGKGCGEELRRRWEDDINMNIMGVCYRDGRKMELAQNRLDRRYFGIDDVGPSGSASLVFDNFTSAKI
jgi:hypothetical protein